MKDIRFPQDCPIECPHLETWDMSIDDWTSICDLLKVQIDNCDCIYNWIECPLTENEYYEQVQSKQ